ncbi:MAG: PDZ domain-containing protein, partial [Candidatus Aminicenantes bacterium]|nr:PDZ domain-containing protein [Candidatus Aminicenantes bacterium]
MKKILFIVYMILIFLFVSLNSAETDRSDSDIKKALKRISPSVVKVVTQNHRRYIATGVAIESDLVLSNIMVLGHPFDRIYIETAKGKTHDVTIVGKDKNSSLILLKTKRKVLRPVKRGKLPETGEWVGLVGVFYKQFPFLNQGIISGSSSNDLILSATVAPGSTGGAVVNRKGEFVGIIRGVFGYKFFPQYTFKDNHSELKIASSVRGGNDLCYAIPSERVFRIAKDLEDFGHVKRGWLGVSIISSGKGFVMVDNVVKSSPAEKGGILKGDKIIDISGKNIKTPGHLSESIKMLRPGNKIVVSLDRNGKQLKVNVKLAELKLRDNKLIRIKEKELSDRMSRMPEFIESLPKIKNYTFEFSGSLGIGVDVIPLTPELAKEFKVKSGNGLLVSKIKSQKPDKSKLKIGDILVNSNGIKLEKVSDLSRSLSRVKPKEKIKIKLIRKGQTLETEVSPTTLTYKTRLFDEFTKKFSDAKFWMEKQQQLKMKEQLEKMKILELRKNALHKKEKKKLQEELEKRRLESLEKYKKEIERLIKEKKAVEEELKKMKKKE